MLYKKGGLMKKIIYSIFLALSTMAFPLSASIVKTTQMEDIFSNKEIKQDWLVLFNIAEVLMDTETSLGTQAWRKYVRTRLDSKLHDKLTLYIFENVPPKPVEFITPEIISHLQKQGVPVFAFTSRGRNEWYSSQIANIDLVTEKLLRQIGMDFSLTRLENPSLAQIESLFADYYHDGIIYATNTYDKGEILKNIMDKTGFYPEGIIFIDDKADSLKSVEESLNEMGIPFNGYAYSRTAKDHAAFDPMIAHIQFDYLISQGVILSDSEAEKIKSEQYQNVDHEEYFYQLIQKWKSLN